MDLVKGLSRRGVFVGLQDLKDSHIPSAISIARHRIGAVIVTGSRVSLVAEEFLEQVAQIITDCNPSANMSHGLMKAASLFPQLTRAYIKMFPKLGFEGTGEIKRQD